ncbi:MAG: RagB/SusD family nutrient uptake outer membrane protein [Tannerella sp.]|jgi:hypothetical protein|nr:RagB/SusD family nutrient uptake outer membrane protein [Tannerella sp.]
MKAEARFLRAYFYFVLIRQYGPVFIWGDNEADILIHPEEVDRHPLDENVNFIVSEYDKAIEFLPLTISDPTWYGCITKGAVMAAKARLLLYAASPLFNGCSLYRGLANMNGDWLFPQSEDPNKWEAAARAAKAVIDLNLYGLCEDNTESDPFRKAMRSYMNVTLKPWNEEAIWGRWYPDGFALNVRCHPPRVVQTGYGGFAPSLKLVDTYPMAASGRYPITGYGADGAPVIDPLSGYSDDGFTNPYTHPLENFAPINAHNNCVGRDARFYTSILANGFNWINTYRGVKVVTFHTGGTSSFTSSGDCVKVGYL